MNLRDYELKRVYFEESSSENKIKLSEELDKICAEYIQGFIYETQDKEYLQEKLKGCIRALETSDYYPKQLRRDKNGK